MRDEIDSLIDDLLVRWHRRSSGYLPARGYGAVSAMFRDAGSTSVRGREADVEDRAERIIMDRFDAQVRKVPQPWYTALCFQARNLACGTDVWSSPRLPTMQDEREVILLEARVKLMRELARDGLLT